LAEPAYGYGERGDNGRTIAQAMVGLLAEDPAGGALEELAASWLAMHWEFQQRLLSGVPLSFRSLFDYADLDSFVPLFQRVGDTTWRLKVRASIGIFRVRRPISGRSCVTPTSSGWMKTVRNGWPI
jgi:hypothetical protein